MTWAADIVPLRGRPPSMPQFRQRLRQRTERTSMLSRRNCGPMKPAGRGSSEALPSAHLGGVCPITRDCIGRYGGVKLLPEAGTVRNDRPERAKAFSRGRRESASEAPGGDPTRLSARATGHRSQGSCIVSPRLESAEEGVVRGRGQRGASNHSACNGPSGQSCEPYRPGPYLVNLRRRPWVHSSSMSKSYRAASSNSRNITS